MAGAGGGTQGLAHWMSVMAEHMNPEGGLHHPYMWPNGIDQKMSLTEQQQLLHKGKVRHFNNQIHFGAKTASPLQESFVHQNLSCSNISSKNKVVFEERNI